MGKWKHINFEQRKIIANQLAKESKLIDIANILDLDPTSISKEIKRNRTSDDRTRFNSDKTCSRVNRYPYVCNGCRHHRGSCPFLRQRYDAKTAQSLADFRLKESRTGLNMSEEEYKLLDKTLKDGINNNHSVYHIVNSNPDLGISVSNCYKLINENKLSIKKHQLPYAVTYKKRKTRKEYEYKENSSINRENRTYLDFLLFVHVNPNLFHVQMDFLGNIRSDKKSILTLSIPALHYVMLFLVESKNQEKITNIYNSLESSLGYTYFTKIFPFILTDRDPCFSNFDQIEYSILTGSSKTKVYYCDSFNSSQKANVEQMNKQLRKFLPKGKSIDHHSPESIKDIECFINSQRIKSLAGSTPNDAFEKIYGSEILSLLKNIII